MSILSSKIILKLLNRVPHSLLVKFGYSKIGSKIVDMVKKNESKTIHELEDGIKIYVDITNPRTWNLMQGIDSEKKIKEAFLKNINLGDTVIDVGANIGEFSLIASKKVGPSGNVVVIEPLKETVVALKKNLELNNFQNCVVEECAIGEKTGKLPLYKKNINATMGLLDEIEGDEQMVIAGKIDVKTIDEIISSNNIDKVSMLKIDVEGHEYEALLGCDQSMKKNKIDVVLCEIHNDYLKKKGIDVKKIYSFLKEHNFSINFIDNDSDTPHILATQSKKP